MDEETVPEEMMAADEQAMMEQMAQQEEAARLEEERQMQEQMAMEQAMMEQMAQQEEAARVEEERQMQEQMAMEQAMMAQMAQQEEAARVEEERQMQEQMAMDQAMMSEPIQLVPLSPGALDIASLPIHPFANLIPRKSQAEYEALKESIRINGLQTQLTVFEHQLLDGRHRLQACLELGLPVMAMEFFGSESDALIHVLSANQYQHELSKSQRGMVAALAIPEVEERVNQERIRKLKSTLEMKREGQCSQKVANTQDTPVDSRAMVAEMMRVNHTYVSYAQRILTESPELAEQVRGGSVSLCQALRELDGAVDDERERRVRTARDRLNRMLRNAEAYPRFLEDFEVFLAAHDRG